MVFLQHAKWMYAAAGSGVAFGIFNYMQSDKKNVQSSWTTNFEPSPKSKWDFNWDKRELSSMIKPAKSEDDPKEQNRINEEKQKKKSTAVRHLFLIRHGQYKDSEKHDKDRKLTDLGKKQADYVGRRLKELGYNYTKLRHSTMTRAKETSEIISSHFPDIPSKSDDLLRENRAIPPEPPCGSYQPEYKFFEGGARTEAAFRKYFHRAKPKQKSASCEIIVCHANVIRYFVCRALQLPPERWLNFSLHHGSITWFVILPSGVVVVRAIGDHGFIPKEYLSR